MLQEADEEDELDAYINIDQHKARIKTFPFKCDVMWNTQSDLLSYNGFEVTIEMIKQNKNSQELVDLLLEEYEIENG